MSCPSLSNLGRTWLATNPRDILLLPAVVIGEIYFGIERMPAGRRRDTLMTFAEDFISSGGPGRVLSFGEDEARTYAKIGAYRQHLGRPIAQLDAQIAAIAAVRGLPVVTRNVADFEKCGVEIINPWEAR
mgnify:CR=1 FL=1